jgi:hypothetical protein
MRALPAVALLATPAWAEESLSRPSTPPDLTLACMSNNGLQKDPFVFEIWLTEGLGEQAKFVQRIEITTEYFHFPLAGATTIYRMTGHFRMTFNKDGTGGFEGSCERAVPKF